MKIPFLNLFNKKSALSITPQEEPVKKAIAIYARVSTNVQDPETQLLPLRDYAARWFQSQCLLFTSSLIHEYVDKGISGAKDRRPALDQLMKDARLHRFDAVVVVRFDRFARSTGHLVLALDEFVALGIDFISLNEAVDTSTPMGKAMFSIIAAIAELERDIIRERVNAGLARARKAGKIFGRPKKIVDRDHVLDLYRTLKSVRAVALQLRKEGIRIGKDKIADLVRGQKETHDEAPASAAVVPVRDRSTGGHRRSRLPRPSRAIPPRPLARKAAAVGSASVSQGADGVSRKRSRVGAVGKSHRPGGSSEG